MKEKKGEGKKKGLRIGFKAKILGLSLPITVIMVVVLITIAYTVSKHDIMRSSEDLLSTSAKDQAHQIESWLNRKLEEVATVKFDIEHSGALEDPAKMQEKLDSYYGLDSDFIRGFYVSDLNGNIVKASDAQSIASAGQVWFAEGITRVNPAFTGAYANEEGVPVISTSGMLNDLENVRVISADLALDSINSIVNSSVSMKNAESLLVDKADIQ